MRSVNGAPCVLAWEIYQVDGQPKIKDKTEGIALIFAGTPWCGTQAHLSPINKEVILLVAFGKAPPPQGGHAHAASSVLLILPIFSIKIRSLEIQIPISSSTSCFLINTPRTQHPSLRNLNARTLPRGGGSYSRAA